MSDDTKTREEVLREVWLEHLTLPDNFRWIKHLLHTLPSKLLVEIFMDLLSRDRKHKNFQAKLLLGKTLSQIRAEDVIDSAEKVAHEHPKFAHIVANVWLDSYFRRLEHEESLDLGFGDYELLAWLWTQTPEDLAERPTWEFVTELIGRWQAATEQQEAKLADEQSKHEAKLIKQEEKHQKKLDQRDRKLDDYKEKIDAERSRAKQVIESSGSVENALEAEKRAHQKTKTHLAELREELSDVEHKTDRRKERYKQSARDIKKRADSLSSDLDELKVRHGDLQTHFGLLKQEKDSLQVAKDSLQVAYDKLEAEKTFESTPLDQDTLAKTLIIDYDSLGDEPHRRFPALLDLYASFLSQKPTDALRESSSLESLQGQYRWQPEGILLLGLERMLMDGVALPIRRFINTSIFSQERLLSTLVDKHRSPRLERKDYGSV